MLPVIPVLWKFVVILSPARAPGVSKYLLDVINFFFAKMIQFP